MKRLNIVLGAALVLIACGDSDIKKRGTPVPDIAPNNQAANSKSDDPTTNSATNNTNPNNVDPNNTNPNNIDPNNTNPNNVDPNNTNTNNVDPNNSNTNNVDPNNSNNGNQIPDIHVQLTWDTDLTDMDLHLAHPLAVDGSKPDIDNDGEPDPWLHTLYDCTWRNNTPDWGASGALNNPVQDIDDTTGYGPENINIATPEDVTYRVGVRYYNDNLGVQSTARVRVFLGGELVDEFVSPLMNRYDMWEVASINAATGVVTPVTVSGGPKITPEYRDNPI